MPPEPTSKTVSVRFALARIDAGDDWGQVLSELYDEGVRAGVQIERQRHPEPRWDPDERTPLTTAQARLQGRPSAAPTAPPPPPRLPRGVPYEPRDSGTTPGTPVPPPPWPPVSRRRRQ